MTGVSGVRGVLTEALDGHYSVQVKVEIHDNWHVARHVCKCGDLYSDLTEHLVDQVLSLPGVAVIQLPEGHDDDGDGLLWPGIGGHPGLYVSTERPDGLVYDDESSYLPAEARDIAGQWAAAAAVADGLGVDGE